MELGELSQLGNDMYKYFVATCAIVLYDYLLTLPDEMTHVWNGRKGLGNILYICEKFVVAEWAITMLLIIPTEWILMTRVYVLSEKSKSLFVILFAVMLAQCALDALPTPSIPTDAFHVCILIPHLPIKALNILPLGLTLAFDAIVFSVTLYYTVQRVRRHQRSPLIFTIQKDGILYFAVIFTTNLIWMVLTTHARPSLKFINAILTSVMINRLTLSLKKASAVEVIHLDMSDNE
ncbi:hypothetical protein BDQ17DRAFT_1357359 [Cyathus striatus]|nr:hypothetical protein BDQ17DRAFT_1357359 [Cyathus striatus]